MYRLENWYFEKKEEKYRVWGNVFDHPHFTEGQWVCTSSLKEIKVKDSTLILKTGHSQYCARFEDHQNVDARVLKKALHDYLWPEDTGLMQKIQYASSRKIKAIPVKDTPEAYRTCAILVFDKEWKELILKHRGKEKTVTAYDIHKGLFQDILELSDPRMDYRFRFFSYQKNHYQFEEWQGKFQPVFIKNTGREKLTACTVYGDFAVAPGTCVKVDPMNDKARIYNEKNHSYTETKVLFHVGKKD